MDFYKAGAAIQVILKKKIGAQVLSSFLKNISTLQYSIFRRTFKLSDKNTCFVSS